MMMDLCLFKVNKLNNNINNLKKNILNRGGLKMSNIYDIFNGRKNAISMISEGFEYEGDIDDTIEDFDSIEEGLEVLTGLQKEMQDVTIKLCAESYVSDLLLEAAMDEEFNEEKLSEMIEESVKEKASNVGKKIQDLWAKIRAWFGKIFQSISSHFMNGEALLKKYPDLKTRLQNSDSKVKCYDLIAAKTAMAMCDGLMGGVKFAEAYNYTGDFKAEIFSKLKVADKKALKEKVMGLFVKDGKFEKKEMVIKSLPTAQVINYAVSKKDIINGLKNQQKLIDADFNSAKQAAQSEKKDITNYKKETNQSNSDTKEAKKYMNNVISVLNYMVNLKTDVVKTEIAVIKKCSSMCLSICRHVCGGESSSTNKNDKNEDNATEESFDYLMSSLDEEVAFDDNFDL